MSPIWDFKCWTGLIQFQEEPEKGRPTRSVASVPVTAPRLWGFLSDHWIFPLQGPQPAVGVDLPSPVQSQNARTGGVSVLNEHQSWEVAVEIPIL